MAEKQVNHLLSTFQRCLALRPQTLLVFSAVVIPTTIWIYDDYRRFLALGPGGNPSTPAGYITVTYLRAFFAHRDPFQPPSLRGDLVYPDRNYLSVDLPARSAPRPVTDGVAPHRMLEQIPPAAVRESLHAAFLALRDAHADIISSGNSCFEKYGLALFLAPGTAKDDPDPRRPANAAFNHLNPTCKTSGEIAHIHDTDASMHITLHPVDAARVIASGWGQRHPVAGVPVHGRVLVPSGFTMVYAPQDEREVEVVMGIVRAGAWWVGGVDLENR